MLTIIRERLRQGHRTSRYPKEEPTLPERFRGRPILKPERCPEGCEQCLERCPFGALEKVAGELRLDLGRCLFCAECAAACPHEALRFSRDHRLACRRREDLEIGKGEYLLAGALEARMKKLFGRSLKLRQVSAGGCNACEADLNVLGTLVFDLGRFGIQFVASPRHADGILVTGPVTENMKSALLDTYAAVPEPKLVIASGACAIGGGPFRDSPEANNGIGDLLPVDLYIPGCPPHPYTALDGLLRLLGRL
ncbi:hydrogenase [Desulfuromonas versatilis]|uniref:Hydrogenase n=1 Tax=Desulfuromonas versatilis TaxID=2802975 RepID=A0ABM8HRV5_9BACT|nr:4Fe-4S dicluster domain-containing protein [Desulfuromonas versatilis]BCR03676.1 hydrogenase [Desulfuromonas versatilis]